MRRTACGTTPLFYALLAVLMAVLGHIMLVRSMFAAALSVTMTHAHSEIGFVGKAPGTYMMLLGGGYYGQRLNKIYRGWLRHHYIFILSVL